MRHFASSLGRGLPAVFLVIAGACFTPANEQEARCQKARLSVEEAVERGINQQYTTKMSKEEVAKHRDALRRALSTTMLDGCPLVSEEATAPSPKAPPMPTALAFPSSER